MKVQSFFELICWYCYCHCIYFCTSYLSFCFPVFPRSLSIFFSFFSSGAFMRLLLIHAYVHESMHVTRIVQILQLLYYRVCMFGPDALAANLPSIVSETEAHGQKRQRESGAEQRSFFPFFSFTIKLCQYQSLSQPQLTSCSSVAWLAIATGREEGEESCCCCWLL